MMEAWHYPHDVPARDPVPLDDLAGAIDPKAGLLWVDCADPTDTEIASIVEQLHIDPLAAEDLAHGDQRTKLDHYEDHFHVAVHDCELIDTTLVSREVDVVFGDGWLVSVRQASEESSAPEPFASTGVARRFELQRVDADTNDEGFLLWAMLDVIVDRYFTVADAVDEHLDAVEEVVFDDHLDTATPREVFDLRRALVRFRRLVTPLREVLSELLRRETHCISERAVVRMQDVYDHVLRVTDVIESQRELLAGLLEANLANASNRTNEVMKRMTSWGAILLGSTLIAGIYGMNFDHMPELHWVLGYPLALASMLLLTVVLYTYFRRRDWL